jgi:transcriptional activator of cad operon
VTSTKGNRVRYVPLTRRLAGALKQLLADHARLSPKAFHLLEVLFRERPNAVARKTLHAEFCPGIFVTDANLPNLVAELRSALGDDARSPRVIRTVRGFGYAFSASARAVLPGVAAPPRVPCTG